MPLEIDALRIFVRVAELASFTRAAEQLGLPKARVSLRIQALEAELGVHLLHRTTRTVRTTPDGDQLLARAKRLVADADELAALFEAPRTLRGLVRVDLPINLARETVIPRLPELLALHPQLELQLSTTDRRVELLREGFDCVLRVGALGDSALRARRIGTLAMVNCASPAYVRKYGLPRTLDELEHHVLVHYSLTLGADRPTFEYRDGTQDRERPMRAVITVNSTDAYRAACLAGLGIIQVPRHGVRAQLAEGSLVEVLQAWPCAPMPVSLVHGHGGAVPKRVRAVMTWLGQIIEEHLR